MIRRPSLAPPRATYRLQFHAGFTFDDAVRIVPYLAKLGVSHVYASPIQQSRPGSTHGYDIVDHTSINSELGGEAGFERLSEALMANALGLILDIVPNHMGVGGADNPAWLSVLEWGADSDYAQTFDIDWERLGAGGKLVVPVLGEAYGDALENGDLPIVFLPEEGSFSVMHHEHRLPLCPLSYPVILERALAALDGESGREALISIADILRMMQEEEDPDRRRGFPREAEALKQRLAKAVAASTALTAAIERAIGVVNGIAGTPESFGTLHRLLEQQAYRPAHWRVAASEINYRRFFDINGLAGVRVEEPAVFQRSHDLIVRLATEGRIQGVRIDHVDGLADPAGYLEALQTALGPDFYVLVEKILEPGEVLRPWPISGTTGYESLNLIDGLLVNGAGADRMEAVYRAVSGLEGRFFDLLRLAKTEILHSSFASELEVLVQDLKRIADADRRTRDYTAYAIRIALSEIIARFPVYRSYLTDEAASEVDRALVEGTIAGARRHTSLPDRSIHDFVARCLLGGIETSAPGRPPADHVSRFRRRFQQLTGPVMAKSLEDTLFYRYARLLALNEVGGDPGHFGISVEAFHAQNAARLAAWPHALISTATHDTKRGEDARARLLCLAEIPDDWAVALDHLRLLGGADTSASPDEVRPDLNDRVIIVQSILGAWPPELLERDNAEEWAAFTSRMQGFVEKALREAKRHTSWVNVDEAYEAEARDWVATQLSPGSAFIGAFRPLALRLAAAGLHNGVVRTVLKATIPGVPDFYQGTEYWDYALVDPDNRRPVDYVARQRSLTGTAHANFDISTDHDGRVKQTIIARLLADRAAHPDLYAQGSYIPLRPSAGAADQIIAFERRHEDRELVVAVRRFPMSGPTTDGARIAVLPGQWQDILSGVTVEVSEEGLEASSAFRTLPAIALRRNAYA